MSALCLPCLGVSVLDKSGFRFQLRHFVTRADGNAGEFLEPLLPPVTLGMAALRVETTKHSTWPIESG